MSPLRRLLIRFSSLAVTIVESLDPEARHGIAPERILPASELYVLNGFALSVFL